MTICSLSLREKIILSQDKHMSVHNYGLGFLHEDITLAYFVFLGDWSSPLSLSVDFSELLAFSRYQCGFSVRQEGHTSQHADILVALGSPDIGRKHSLASFIGGFFYWI